MKICLTLTLRPCSGVKRPQLERFMIRQVAVFMNRLAGESLGPVRWLSDAEICDKPETPVVHSHLAFEWPSRYSSEQLKRISELWPHGRINIACRKGGHS